MNEKLIERKLREGVRRLGGLALKFHSEYHTGMPDRVVLMPGGHTYWVELKTTGEKLRPLQRVAVEDLTRLGFDVRVIDDQTELDHFLEEIAL